MLNETAYIHQTILKFFTENFTSISELNKVNCCCRCAETIIKFISAHNMWYIQSNVHVTKTVRDTLTDWRNEKESVWNDDYIFSDSQILLPNSVLQTISHAAELIDDLVSLKDCVRMKWAEFEKFESNVLIILLRARCTVQETNQISVQTQRALMQSWHSYKKNTQSSWQIL